MMKRRFVTAIVVLLLLFAAAPGTTHAALNAVDPGPYLAANGFFPAWYQDTNGLGLDLCLSGANIAAGAVPDGVGGAACVLPFPPPFTFPGNFPDESFYFMADAVFTANGVDVTYVANLEAAFAGQQIVFARIRIRITLPGGAPGGNYTVTHPYGVDVFSVAPGGGIKVINATRDIGVADGIFTGALKGDIGPFLRDASLAPGVFIPSSVAGEFYIGDPNTPRPVQGSPFETNFVRVDGPAPFASVQSNLFNVMGKVHQGALATPLLVERTSYGRTGTAPSIVAQQDVFAKAPPSTDAAVTFTDANGALFPMTDANADGAWYGQSPTDPTGTARTVSATATATTGPNTPTTVPSSPLVDVVTISRAEYSLASGTLTVEAASSDEVTPLPALTANATTLTPTGAGVLQSATIPGFTIPPATVTVTSDKGGSDTEQVVVLP